jgi:OTU-like cysteine protease
MPASLTKTENIDLRFLNGSVDMAYQDGRRKLPIMVRQGRKSTKPSWPFMELWGLHRRPIEADGMLFRTAFPVRLHLTSGMTGNCLFRALSDQLYNTTERHGEIRHRVVEYLRTSRSHFEPFVLANVGEDLIRSQPTTRSSRSRKPSLDDDAFQIYLENMAKPKTWGGDIEITAFCEAYDRDVLIHRPTDAEHPFNVIVNSKRVAGQPKVIVHISYGVSILLALPILPLCLIAGRMKRHSPIMSPCDQSRLPPIRHLHHQSPILPQQQQQQPHYAKQPMILLH